MNKISITGDDAIWENLKELQQGMRDKILKDAMKATLKPIQGVAQRKAPRDLGTLKGAVDSKVSSKGSKGETVKGWVGIRRNIKVPVRVVKRGKNKGKMLVAIPTRYAHLIEFGHKVVVGGKVVGTVAAKPFMRPAWDEYGGENAVYTFADVAQEGIKKAIDRIRYVTSLKKP